MLIFKVKYSVIKHNAHKITSFAPYLHKEFHVTSFKKER